MSTSHVVFSCQSNMTFTIFLSVLMTSYTLLSHFCVADHKRTDQQPENERREDEDIVDHSNLDSFSADSAFSRSLGGDINQFDYLDNMPSSVHVNNGIKLDQDFPLIIWWTPSLYPHTDPSLITCGDAMCYSSNDRGRLKDPNTRVLIFYGTDVDPSDLPLPRLKWHEWALLHEESPLNNFILSHHAFIQLFNHTSTFRRESDYPLSLQYLYSLNYLTVRRPVPLEEKNKYREEPQSYSPVLYVHSHCGVASDRDRYMEELMKHIAVDSYGTCLHNKDLPEEMRNPAENFEESNFLKFIAKYKFHISFENALCNDYMTEKLFRALHLGSLPIYRGSPVAKDWMPNNQSVIMADDFDSPKELAAFIDYLDKNDDEYEKYLNFKTSGGITNQFLLDQLAKREWGINVEGQVDYFQGFECHVCRNVYQRMAVEKIHSKDPNVQLLPPKIANHTHLGCQQPYTSIGLPDDVPPDDRWLSFGWIEQYWAELEKAFAVRDMLQAGETDPSKFEKYWTDYLKKSRRH